MRTSLLRVSHMVVLSMWNPMFLFRSSVLGPSLRLPFHKYLHSFATLAWPALCLFLIPALYILQYLTTFPFLAVFLDRAEFRPESFLHSFVFLCCYLVPTLLLSVLYTYTIRICTHTHPLVGHHSITRRIRLNVLNCFREKGGHLDTPYLLQDSSTQSTLSFAPHRTTTTLLCTCDMRP